MNLTKNELRSALVAERKKLLEMVASLSDEQLGSPTLCEGWTCRNVLSHVISFELHNMDGARLLFRAKELNDITAIQSKRYAQASREEYAKLLHKGLDRSLRLLRLTPSLLLNRKFIPVPHGRLSIGQIFGDLIMDRAIHRLDIASPLKIANTIDDGEVMHVCITFILSCIGLLNVKIPNQFYGQYVELNLSGKSGGQWYWEVGTDNLITALPNGTIVLKVAGDTNDFVFTVSVRESLITNPLHIEGDQELASILKTSLNANALWES